MGELKIEEVFGENALKILTTNDAHVIKDIDENYDGMKIGAIDGKVVHLFDTTHESIAQSGLIGDSTGIIKFVIWAKGKVAKVEKGKVYQFNGYKVNVYQGKASIVTTDESVNTLLDKEIKVIETATGMLGCFIVELKKAAMTKLCDDPVVQDCKKKNKWGFDLRLVGDTGQGVVTIDVRDFKILDLSVDSIKKEIIESGNPNVLFETFENRFVGHYLTLNNVIPDQHYFLITNKAFQK